MNEEHEKNYYEVLGKMKKQDCYHKAVAYLFTLDTVCREHIDDLFDYKGDAVFTDAFRHGWQTGTSMKTTRLAFNLWVSYIDEEAKYSGVDAIFCCGYAPYYVEAIKLRFPEYF